MISQGCRNLLQIRQKKVWDVSHRISIDISSFRAPKRETRIQNCLKADDSSFTDGNPWVVSNVNGYSVYMQLPGQKQWSCMSCTNQKSVLPAKKVMLGAVTSFVPSITQSRGEMLTNEIHEILIELHQANSARTVYEGVFELPLEDLFYVGGQLQSLIRRAEQLLRDQSGMFLDYVHTALNSRVEEARAFRRYIITRIRMGS